MGDIDRIFLTNNNIKARKRMLTAGAEKVSKSKTESKRKPTKKPIFAAMRDVYLSMCRKNKIDIPTTQSLQQVMGYAKLSKAQACLFSYFAVESVNGSMYFDMNDLQTDMDVMPSEYGEYYPDMDYLLKKNVLSCRFDVPYIEGSFDSLLQFVVADDVLKRAQYNQKFEPHKPTNTDTVFDTLSYLTRVNREGWTNKVDYYSKIVNALYKDDPILKPLIPETMDAVPEGFGRVEEPLQFFTYAGSYLLKDDSISCREVIETVIRNATPRDVIDLLKTFKNETNYFIKEKIFEVDKNNFGDDMMIMWGNKAKEMIFKGDNALYLHQATIKELGKINVEDIKAKELFYNPANAKDIERLENLCKEETFQEMRKRLEEKNLPKGLTILLHGAPGTGKTETVMQIAKKTGRSVLHVNIQEIRNCWVGESEKNIKKVFDTYRSCTDVLKPILLFNEADAIISKRSSLDGDRNASVTKMENSIQNIILEEFEKFDGICCLTSNMTDNLDSAFDRRLLFKLKFENPTLEVKQKIWKNKMPELSDEDSKRLANEFDLSGGQIDNIVRKSEMDYILYGTKPDINQLIDFCQKEKLQKTESKRIGFGA